MSFTLLCKESTWVGHQSETPKRALTHFSFCYGGQVEVPTCAGAEALWRSTTAGWEKLETASFEETRTTVELDHFCEIVITGKCRPLKGLGFLHPRGENAQVVVMHIGCESCEDGLELLCSDPDVLQHFRRCSPNLQLGTFRHDEDLEIKQPGRTSKMKIRFLMSAGCH